MKYDEVLGDLRGQKQIEVLQEQDDNDLNELEQATQDVPAVRLVNAIFTDALKKRASDIHIEPYEKIFRVRFRIDGVLHEILQPPLSQSRSCLACPGDGNASYCRASLTSGWTH
jgi:type IV pilus assembly protein PilB